MAKRFDKYQIDVEQASFEFEGVNGTLQGMSNNTAIYLACIGAIKLLEGRKDPQKVWDQICDGSYFKPRKKHPIVVQAWANLKDMPLETAAAQWAELTRQQKYDLKNLPQIRMEVARLQGGDQPLSAPQQDENH